MTFSASSCVTLDSIRADSMRLLAGVDVIAHLHYRFASNHNLSHQKRSATSKAASTDYADYTDFLETVYELGLTIELRAA